jgi:glycosyltransferase involved in cell wall biosynthesis
VSNALVVVTPVDRDAGLKESVGRRDQYHTIRSGVDLERFRSPARSDASVRAELGVPAGAPVVGSVMRLSEQKAPVDWVRVAARVGAQRPDVHFVIVGDGPLRVDTEAAADADGVSDRLHIAGMRDDVPDFLQIFDVFLLASHWEGLPRVLPQAMAASVPVVATAVDGTREAVRDGETGYLAPAGAVETLAARVVELLADPERARGLGAAGRRLSDEFSEARMIENLRALYRAVDS